MRVVDTQKSAIRFLENAPNASHASSLERLTRRKDITILLAVDNSESIKKSLQLLLRADGYQVETANDGSEALQKLKMINPHIILLDTIMAPMDGLTFLKSLIHAGICKNYAIIVMTAMSGLVDDLREMHQQGIIYDFIIKPFVFPDRLLHELHRIEIHD